MKVIEKVNEPDKGVEIRREQIHIAVDALVQQGDHVYRITQVLDFNSVVGTEVVTGRAKPLIIADLTLVSDPGDPKLLVDKDLTSIADKDWQIAQERLKAIEPLLAKKHVGQKEREERAKEINVSPASLYRWLKRYKNYGVVTALIPMKRGWSEGRSRISPLAEQIIEETIQDYYLTPQRPTVHDTLAEVLHRCHKRAVQAPSHMTIRSRIGSISEKEKLNRRGFKEKARKKFLPTPGHFPKVEHPLAVVQIDHTPVDIILVDDEYRQPIGRPWLTLAIDVYSRMVTGYHLTFESPSEQSVAMCVVHSILPKEEWMLLHDVKGSWPVWGIPKTIHTDNGAEFRSDNFRRSCLPYGINLEFRPVKTPHYGGHIERLIGTFMRKVHKLPGTTYSNVEKREGSDPEKSAVMTLSEFQAWFVSEVVNGYHNEIHSNLGMTPLQKWEIGIHGNAETKGVGLPARPANRQTLEIDFLPAEFRTVQTFGVSIDNIVYYADCLRGWINATDPGTGEKIKLAFRRNLSDISYIWFYDPKVEQYFKVPSLDMPSISIWEHRKIKADSKSKGIRNINSDHVWQHREEQKKRHINAAVQTKKIRKEAQRQLENAKGISPAKPLPSTVVQLDRAIPNALSSLFSGDVDDFGGIA